MDTFAGRRLRVVKRALTCKGTPYVPRAYKPGLGLDCGTLLHYVYSAWLPLPEMPSDYPSDWAMHQVDTRYLDFIKPFVVEVPRPVTGGISVWQVGCSFSHAGIRLRDTKKVLHACGRTEFGTVQVAHQGFFNTWGRGEPQAGRVRPVMHYDLQPHFWEMVQ